MKNIILDKKKKLVVVNVNSIFYPKEHVEQACKDYKEICSTKISSSKKEIKITLEPKKSVDINVLGLEFMNYLLSLSRVEGI